MAGVDRLLARVPGTTHGSRLRNLSSYFIAGMCCVMILETLFASYGLGFFSWGPMAWGLVGLSVLYFAFVVVAVIFFTSQDFRVSPTRLARDTLLSIVFTILAFAVFHRVFGITLTGTCPEPHNPVDALYFSAVTFSTLGYGDFRPCPNATSRLIAAFQAIFGNLHLGLVVGAAFFFAQHESAAELTDEKPDKVDHTTDNHEG